MCIRDSRRPDRFHHIVPADASCILQPDERRREEAGDYIGLNGVKRMLKIYYLQN